MHVWHLLSHRQVHRLGQRGDADVEFDLTVASWQSILDHHNFKRSGFDSLKNVN